MAKAVRLRVQSNTSLVWTSSSRCDEISYGALRDAIHWIYQGVLYFMSIVQLYGTRVHVISFASVIKSLPSPVPVFAKFTNAQRPSVSMYTAFHANGTIDMTSTYINSSTPWSESLNRFSQNSCLFYKFIWRTPVPNFMKIQHCLVADVRS